MASVQLVFGFPICTSIPRQKNTETMSNVTTHLLFLVRHLALQAHNIHVCIHKHKHKIETVNITMCKSDMMFDICMMFPNAQVLK